MKTKVFNFVRFASLFLFFVSTLSFSQVGIGTTSPNPNSILDIQSDDKGILIPRIFITDENDFSPLSGTAEGMLVYNTNPATGVGFKFWQNDSWNVLADGSGKDWSTEGNENTNPVTDFIGTTDATDLTFKTNNTTRLLIENNTNPVSGTAGDILIGDDDSGTLKANTELVLRQDGDDFGSSVLRLRNRNGANGVILETINASAYLADFIFKTGPDANPLVSNIRFETRVGSKKIASNSTEFQFGKPNNEDGGPTLVVGADGDGSHSSFRIGNLGIGTVNPTAKLEIDASAENIPSLEIVPHITAPAGTANGQIAVIDNSLYMYDTGRNKWLSVETLPFPFGVNGNANNTYAHYATASDQNSGAKMPFNGTIIAITAQSSGGLANKGFEIRKNGTTTSLFSFNLSSKTYLNTTTNIDFNAGDFLNVYVVNDGGGPANAAANPATILFIKWRK